MAKVEEIQNKIADRIDVGTLAALPQGTTNLPTAFIPTDMGQLMEFSKVMSTSTAVPPHLRGKPGDCMAVAMQAFRWKMDPFAVASKSYFVNDRIAYEAQLVNAVINAHAPLQGRLKVEWTGQDQDLICIVTGKIKGDPDPKRIDAEIRTITTRNSPLWKQQPRQQLAYYATRMWCRLYASEAMLGIYSPDELEESRHQGPDNARDVTPPRPVRSDFQKPGQPSQPESADAMPSDPDAVATWPLVDHFGEEHGPYSAEEFHDPYYAALQAAAKEGLHQLETLMANNTGSVLQISGAMEGSSLLEMEGEARAPFDADAAAESQAAQ